ncbi:hypothetical protein D3C86_1723400 [compost metagenome]
MPPSAEWRAFLIHITMLRCEIYDKYSHLLGIFAIVYVENQCMTDKDSASEKFAVIEAFIERRLLIKVKQ